MKFIISTNGIEAGSGGAQKVVSLLSSELAEQGHQVMLILYNDRSKEEYRLSDKVQVHVLPKNKKNKNKLEYYIEKLKVLRNLVLKFAPDAIIPFLSEPTLYLFLATRFTKYNRKIVTTVRNNPKIFPKKKRIRIRNNLLIAFNRACMVQNEKQKNYFPKFIQQKTFILPNPVSDELLHCQNKKGEITRFVTLGRLNEQKNQHMLIQSFAKAAEGKRTIQLDIFGDGELKEELHNLIQKFNMEHQIHLCGITNDVKKALEEHDAFIMTSNFEGMPNALIEAMAAGLPCISTNCPTGPSDLIINKKNGILIDMNDITACTEAINYYIEHKEEAHAFGELAKQTIINSYTCKKIVEQLVDACRKYLIF